MCGCGVVRVLSLLRRGILKLDVKVIMEEFFRQA